MTGIETNGKPQSVELRDKNGKVVEIVYEMRGSGPPLLATMGLGGQITDWSPGFIDRLAEHFTVILYDNRDIGLSTEFTGKPPTRFEFLKARLFRRPLNVEYRLSDMAGDSVGLLDALGFDAAHLIGVSMGGMISQAIAIDHPQKTLSLTSIMSNTGDNKNGVASPRLLVKLSRMEVPAREEAVDFLTDQYELFGGSSWDKEAHRLIAKASVERSWRPAGVERQLAAIAASPDRTEALGKVRVPALVIHGLQDPLVPPKGGIATSAAMPSSRLLMFPDMGHDLPANRWDEMVAAIVRTAGV